MKLLLNGEARDVPDRMSVADLLQWLEIDPRRVAVELNRKVIARARYADTRLSEDAEVEIVAFVGGGSRTKRRRSTSDRRAWRRRTRTARRSRRPRTD